MKSNSLRYSALVVLLLTVSCTTFAPPPAIPASDLTTFTDQNRYYQVQLPKDWKHEHASGNHYYVDTFSSSDGNAAIQNIAYNDGTRINISTNAQLALDLLGKYFGGVGQSIPITVMDTSMMNDGSERLNWTSDAIAASGISFVEVRNDTIFLVFTVEWKNNYKNQYFNLLDQVVASYTVP